MLQTQPDWALTDAIPPASNHATSCWLKPASIHKQSPAFFVCVFFPELTASMNCRWVNDVPGWESGGSGVISACLSHCHAAPYLTLLLFPARALQRSGQRRKPGKPEDGQSGLKTFWQMDLLEKKVRHWARDGEVSALSAHLQRIYEGLLCQWSASNRPSLTSGSPCRSQAQASLCTLQKNCHLSLDKRKRTWYFICSRLSFNLQINIKD